VGDRKKLSGEWGIGITGNDASGLGECFQTVEPVVGSGNTGTVGIGLFKFQSRGCVVEPGGGVSVGSMGRIGGNVALVCPEGGQGNHMVVFVVSEACRLNGGAKLSCLPASNIVGIAGGASQSIRDAGGSVTAGGVGSGSDIALCVGCPDSAFGQVGFDGSDIAASIGLLLDHALRSERELPGGMNTRMVALAYGKTIHNKRFGDDIRSGNAAEPGAFGRGGVFRPLNTLLAVNVSGNGFAFQYRVQLRNHGFGSLCERQPLGIISYGGLYLINTVFPYLVAGGTFRYPVFSGITRMQLIQKNSLFYSLAQFIVFR